jgi:hypothetical protein
MDANMDANEDDRTLRDYWLGRLTPDETRSVEERRVRDPEYRAGLEVAEDELLSAFSRNALSEKDEEHFLENYLTSSERLRKVEYARIAPGAIEAEARARGIIRLKRRPRPFVLLTLAASITALVAAGIVWLANRPPASPPPTDRVARLVLESGITRSAGTLPRLEITAATSRVEFTIRRSDPAVMGFARFEAALTRLDGEMLARLSNLTLTDGVIRLTLPPTSFPGTSEYVLELSGLTPEGQRKPLQSYPFRVERR